ncbi:metal-dependent hydrolase [Mycolicibacterium komossense]|uniref:Metal-dependent hydrolase n=1 Tax=Mycolicibacterium komossense TaxID=1779 RepID=A0ABT3CFV7_9MYCO|nr:metal-dependent hydrolase [Mycolicibacterium komossense]
MTTDSPVSTTIRTNGKAPASAYPKVRRMKFRFGEPEPIKRHFVEGDIALSHLMAILSGTFPPGEESFIRSVRRFSDQITDPVLKKRVAAFVGQEAVHGQQHRELNEKLIEKGYLMVRFLNFGPNTLRQKLFVFGEKLLPAKVHLALTAAAEHYTATLGLRVLETPEIQAIPADPEAWHLLNWHAFEELEHKSVAFDVYRAVGGPEWIRIAVMRILYYFTIPVATAAVAVSVLTDPSGWRPIKLLRQAYGIFRGPILGGLMAEIRPYMRRGFHPDDIDTDAVLQKWQKELFGTEGILVDRAK